MSILSDFFIARPADITEDLIRRGPTGRYPTVEATFFTPLEMALLLAVIEGRTAEEAVRDERCFDVADLGDEGPWLTRLPSALRDALAPASVEDLRRYTTRWLEFEELSRADPGYMTSLLERLGELSRTA